MSKSLKPCPFCNGLVMHRHALWPSEGDTDAIIHSVGGTCGAGNFNIGTADQGVSVAEAWNHRTTYAETTALQFIQAAVDSAPEPLRRLGEYLSTVLDEDRWKTAERMLLGAAFSTPSVAGWTYVPLEPTPLMIREGKYVLKGASDEPEWRQAESVYRIMVAATPKATP